MSPAIGNLPRPSLPDFSRGPGKGEQHGVSFWLEYPIAVRAVAAARTPIDTIRCAAWFTLRLQTAPSPGL